MFAVRGAVARFAATIVFFIEWGRDTALEHARSRRIT